MSWGPHDRCGAAPWSTGLQSIPWTGWTVSSVLSMHFSVKISLNAPCVCAACPRGNSPVRGGHSDCDTQDRVRRDQEAQRGGAGTACISSQTAENQEAGWGTSPGQPCLAPSYLLSADVHVPHCNSTIRGTGDQLPRELQVTQRLHSVTANTQQSLPQAGTHTVFMQAPVSPLAGISNWHFITNYLV